MKNEKATFAAGCFWGVEEKFRTTEGVTSTKVGYIGGHTDNPNYESVCSKTTGHAEAVELEFDQEKISYEALLNIFWHMHNPTTLNRQGPDFGSQYRSAIFYHSDEQKALAEKTKAENQSRFTEPIVTEITKAPTFWDAEDYHQQYFMKRGGGSCHI